MTFLNSVLEASHKFQEMTSSRNNLIKHMPWESVPESALGLSKDQMRFMLSLFASVLVGAGIRGLKNPTLRHLYSLVTGVLLTYYPFGAGVVHALPPALLTYLAMLVSPRNCGMLAWMANFPYLIYLHVVNASGESWMQGQMDFTGCEMVLVLKLISIAVCYQDGRKRKKEDLSPYQAAHALDSVPSLLEYLSFVFSLGNLLAGPYIEFHDYKEFIEFKGVWDPNAAKPMPSVVMPTVNCLVEIVLSMGGYLRLVPVYNVHTFKTAWYITAPLYKKIGIILVCGITNQLKYCFSWKLSEASLTLAGINFYGWDEKTGKGEWGRYRNVRFFRLITCDTARMVTFYWNIGTGTFLRRYVYERLVPRGKRPGFAQLLATQTVSAIWHGLYAGYLLFFLGTALWIFFSTQLYKLEEKYAPHVSHMLPWRAVKIFWTNFVLNYMASAFMILDLHGSLAVYRSVYYFPHIIMLVGCVVGPTLVGKKRTPKAEAGKGDTVKSDAGSVDPVKGVKAQ